jgi:hypothetical protein
VDVERHQNRSRATRLWQEKLTLTLYQYEQSAWVRLHDWISMTFVKVRHQCTL